MPNTVAEAANGISQPSFTNYYYSQSWPLTADQVPALLAGKWYVVVSYGSDQYAGILNPTHIEPPSAAVSISPGSVFPSPGVPEFPGGNATAAVISPARNKPAKVTLDGSNSSDPFSLPLGFLWLDENDPIADTTTTTLTLMPGNYQFQLEVYDAYNTNSATAVVHVLSPEDAIGVLSSRTANAGINKQITRKLTSTLQQAQMLLQRGDSFSGTRELTNFQRDVNLFAGKMDSTTANWLIAGAQEIIDAVEGTPGRNP